MRSRDGANYIAPTVASDKRVLDQGFSVEVLVDWKVVAVTFKQLGDEGVDVIFAERMRVNRELKVKVL